jgi:hypothetical protein
MNKCILYIFYFLSIEKQQNAFNFLKKKKLSKLPPDDGNIDGNFADEDLC